MFFKCLLLSLSASIDALSLGITYGIKKTKLCKTSNIIIFATVLVLTGISVLIGHYVSLLFSPAISTFIGSLFLILLGIYNIFKSQNNVSKDFDFDGSNCIDKKEALMLGFAVAIDAACVSLSSGMLNLGNLILPIFMAFFHTFFVNCGSFAASTVINKFKFSNTTLSVFSGTILILIGFLKAFY